MWELIFFTRCSWGRFGWGWGNKLLYPATSWPKITHCRWIAFTIVTPRLKFQGPRNWIVTHHYPLQLSIHIWDG